MYYYTFHAVNAHTGELSHREELNFDELDSFMVEARRRHAACRVRRNDGRTVWYDDNGTDWVRVAAPVAVVA